MWFESVQVRIGALWCAQQGKLGRRKPRISHLGPDRHTDISVSPQSSLFLCLPLSFAHFSPPLFSCLSVYPSFSGCPSLVNVQPPKSPPPPRYT